MVYGEWYGSGHSLEPGGLSYEASYMPHGGRFFGVCDLTCLLMAETESIEKWEEATTVELAPQRSPDLIGMWPSLLKTIALANMFLAFMFHITAHVAITEYAMKASNRQGKFLNTAQTKVRN